MLYVLMHGWEFVFTMVSIAQRAEASLKPYSFFCDLFMKLLFSEMFQRQDVL